ncbi:MAG: TetR/AcrR family transcriptional regulator [Pseudomonadota bacterium]
MARTDIDGAPAKDEGLRERKRRATLQRIAETGLQLFLTHGYERTTLDAIAAEAGISRRTFFSYFKSKEDILLTWQSGTWDALRADLLKESPDQTPLDAVCKLMVKHVSRFESEQLFAIDRLMRSTEALRTLKQAGYGVQEQALYTSMCEVWRQPERHPGLRLVAMAAVGAMRVALEACCNQTGDRPAAKFLEETFETLKSEIRFSA